MRWKTTLLETSLNNKNKDKTQKMKSSKMQVYSYTLIYDTKKKTTSTRIVYLSFKTFYKYHQNKIR